MTGSRRISPGFTLVEMLVALFIFGLLAAAGTALLSFGIGARERVTARLDDLAALARARALLGADLAQAAPRPWRDAAGLPQPAFVIERDRLLLVRRGWANPGGAPRASLQRVEYRLADGRLERRAAPMLDGAPFGPPAVLLTGIDGVRLRVVADGGWRHDWQAPAPDSLPRGVELTLSGATLGAVRQLFLVGPA